MRVSALFDRLYLIPILFLGAPTQIFVVPQTYASSYLQLFVHCSLRLDSVPPFISLAKSYSSLKILYKHHLRCEAFPDLLSCSLEGILLSYVSSHIHVWHHIHHSIL